MLGVPTAAVTGIEECLYAAVTGKRGKGGAEIGVFLRSSGFAAGMQATPTATHAH